jgi:hypothetical protein
VTTTIDENPKVSICLDCARHPSLKANIATRTKPGICAFCCRTGLGGASYVPGTCDHQLYFDATVEKPPRKAPAHSAKPTDDHPQPRATIRR